MDVVEGEFNQKFSEVQKQTALRVLSRYFRANAKPVATSTQTDDNTLRDKQERLM